MGYILACIECNDSMCQKEWGQGHKIVWRYIYRSRFQPFTTSLLSYLHTPWNRVLLEKVTGSAASQEIPRIFGTQRFITVLTSARHLSLSWDNSIQSPQTPPTSWRSILILSYHLHLGLPNGFFPSGFPTRKCLLSFGSKTAVGSTLTNVPNEGVQSNMYTILVDKVKQSAQENMY